MEILIQRTQINHSVYTDAQKSNAVYKYIGKYIYLICPGDLPTDKIHKGVIYY